MDIQKLYITSPRGFCAGVSRAIDIVELVLRKHGKPVYVRHNIVHNDHVVADFKKRGVVFVEDIMTIPNKSIVVFSAHGSAPKLYVQAQKKNLTLYDATCPLVTKVHIEAKRYAKEGCHIIYIGHKNHPEGIGVMGEVSQTSLTMVDSVGEVSNLSLSTHKKIAVLTQTTLSMDDTKEIISDILKKYPNSILPPALDICYATQNRQNAVKKIARLVDVLFVVGSKTSSNSNKLREVAMREGTKSYLINDSSDIDQSWLQDKARVGITAGASAPEHLVTDLIHYLSDKKTIIEEVHTILENINFPRPVNL